MITLPPLDGAGDRLWNSLLDIAELMPRGWTLIGGQMVLLHTLEAGTISPRVARTWTWSSTQGSVLLRSHAWWKPTRRSPSRRPA